jgi:hypothetical protein
MSGRFDLEGFCGTLIREMPVICCDGRGTAVRPFYDAADRMRGSAAAPRGVAGRFDEMRELRRRIAARGGK